MIIEITTSQYDTVDLRVDTQHRVLEADLVNTKCHA